MKNNKSSNYNKSYDDDIEISRIFNFFLRNKNFISLITFVFFLLSCFYALSKKRVWQGQFEIVLKLNQDSFSRAIIENPLAASFLGKSLDVTNNLETEVAILESPSVLMPIFKYVQNEKISESSSNIVFSKWREDNLNIKLKQKTSILQISYRDKDKELIKSVLNKISIAYQQYSGKSKRNSISLSKNYLINKVEDFKIKSANSFKFAQDYAIKNDLNTIPVIPPSSQSLKDSKSYSYISPTNNVDIEAIRLQAAHKIRNINQQLKRINSLENDEDFQFIGLLIPALDKEGMPQKLKDIEQEILEKKQKFTEKDKSLVTLYQKKELLKNLLIERSKGILNAEKIIAQARMEAATRPEGVFLQYKEFIRQAARDEETLINLENQLMLLKLEEAKNENPWELITKPTLLKSPVAPKRKNIGLMGIFLGFITGSIFSLYKEKKSGLIYDQKELEKLFNTKIIEKKYTDLDKNFLINQIRYDPEIKKINVIYNEDEGDLINKLKDLFNISNLKRELIFEKIISKLKPADINLLVISDKLDKKYYENLKSSIELYDINLFGIILKNSLINLN